MASSVVKPGQPIQKLLFFIAQDVPSPVERKMRAFVEGLATMRKWVIKPPYVTDIVDAAKGVGVGVGAVLEIYSASPLLPRDVDEHHLEEVKVLVSEVQSFSRDNDLEFEF